MNLIGKMERSSILSRNQKRKLMKLKIQKVIMPKGIHNQFRNWKEK